MVMDRNNPNRTFRSRKYQDLVQESTTTSQEKSLVFGRKTIEKIREVRMATGIGLTDAKAALNEAEFDAQVAIERIKQQQAAKVIVDDIGDLWEFDSFLDDEGDYS